MASTYSTNLHIELQGTGDNSGTWGTVLNTTALSIIDQCLGDVQTVSLSGSNVTLSTSQSQHNYFRLTGTLLANVTLTWPAIGRTVYVYNATSGSYSITLANAGGGSTVVIPQGNGLMITTDPTNGVIADPIPFGTSQTIAGAATIDLGAAPARNVTVSGSGWTCTSFGSSASTTCPVYLITFSSTGTITYNATSMITPGALSINVGAGDVAFASYLGSGNWRILDYTPAAQALIGYKFIGIQTFTASGTYTPTSGCRLVRVIVIGGGGGGGGGYYSGSGSANNAGGGGGEGATAIYVGTAGATSTTVTIGPGGAGGTGTATGTAGTASSFGALAVAGGGAGGVGANSSGIFNASRGGAGGTASAGTIQIGGADGQAGVAAGSSGDDMAAGGTGGGKGGRGGVVTESGSAAGTNAPGYGGGGGGGCRADSGSSVAGGTGGNGIVIVEEYA